MVRPVAAGRLRHRITLQSPAGTRDAYGERSTTWTDVATVWAAVEPLSAAQLAAAAQIHTEANIRVTLRHSTTVADVGPDWRVKFGDRILVIAAAPRNVDEAGSHIELLCSEGLREE